MQFSTQRLAEIQPEPMFWIWQPFIPLGTLITLEGHPGVGKSAFTHWLAAHVTRPKFSVSVQFFPPDLEPVQKQVPINVGLIAGEDHGRATIRPRLEMMGAKLDQIFISHFIEEGKLRTPIDLDEHFKELCQFVNNNMLQLLIIDPWLAFLNARVISNESLMRNLLFRLRQLAENTRCTILLVRHLHKNHTRGAEVLASSGCVGVSAMSRLVLRMELTGKKNESQLRVIKTNLTESPKPFRFRWHSNCLVPFGNVEDIAANPNVELAKTLLQQHNLEVETVAEVKRSLFLADVNQRDYRQAVNDMGYNVIRKNMVWYYRKSEIAASTVNDPPLCADTNSAP